MNYKWTCRFGINCFNYGYCHNLWPAIIAATLSLLNLEVCYILCIYFSMIQLCEMFSCTMIPVKFIYNYNVFSSPCCCTVWLLCKTLYNFWKFYVSVKLICLCKVQCKCTLGLVWYICYKILEYLCSIQNWFCKRLMTINWGSSEWLCCFTQIMIVGCSFVSKRKADHILSI